MKKRTSIGIDIGKRKCDVCIVDSRGKVLERDQYPNTAEDARRFAEKMARKYMKRNDDSCTAACETTGNMWARTYKAFEAAGIPIQLANTYKMAVISKTGKKTDKVDAEKIAQVLRMGMIPECYVPSAGVRATRGTVRQRIRLVRDRTRVINRVHSMLDKHDIIIDASQMYSEKALGQMWAASLDTDDDEFVLKQHAIHIRNLNELINTIDTRIEREAAANEDAVLLASMTGFGLYSALLLAVEIGDISRFDSPKKMVSWAGLCPTVHQSGDQLYLGKMKKMDTNKLVNWTMCEVANVAVQHDERMAAVYESAKRRHAGKHALAIVVVANKMVTIAWHMLTSRTPYESRNPEMYQRKLDRMDRAHRRTE